MATLTILNNSNGTFNAYNRSLSFSINVNDLDTSFEGIRKIQFYLNPNNTGNFVYISGTTYGSREISGNGNYYFEAGSTYLATNNSYTGYFELIYKNVNESQWTTALTSESNSIKIPPEKFYFSQSITAGASTNTLTAVAWNNFCARVNEFRQYKGLSTVSFTQASSGGIMTAAIMAQPWDAINAISGHGTMPTRPSQGETIYASYFHSLADALNSIS